MCWSFTISAVPRRKTSTPLNGRGYNAPRSPPTQCAFVALRRPAISATLSEKVTSNSRSSSGESLRRSRPNPAPSPLRHFPARRGSGAEGVVPGPAAIKTGSGLRRRTPYHYKMRVFVNDEEKTQLGDQTSCGTTETRLAAQPTGDFRKPSPATVFAILEVIGRMSGVTATASWSMAAASSICAEG
jgi:hypothetical protein